MYWSFRYDEFLAADETGDNNHPIRMKLVMVDLFTKKEIKAWAEKNLEKVGFEVVIFRKCFNKNSAKRSFQ